ncbi:putative transcription factor interactor and regulator CCHC(Zn) family [Helianthus anomalus]
MYINLLPGTSLGTKTFIHFVIVCPFCTFSLSNIMPGNSINNPKFLMKPPKLHYNDDEDHRLPLTSGIRAGYASDDDLKPSSTMLPCTHCTEEKRERKWMQRCCYYCNRPGHKISACQEKKKDEESQFVRLAVNTKTQKRLDAEINQQTGQRQEYMVIGTDGGY